ncbi:MAG: pyridoxal phosphate-dependent aminotransferase [Candidatus Eremiobacteraeota bacterium]|nr:pyridoxal phosphate-dependent aminotransferase [Candidatus Eremiobacteraeota bacterium]
MLNQRAKNLSPSPTMAIDGRAKQLKADGVDVLNLSVGEPDFDTPETAKSGGRAAIDAGFTKYTAAAGIMELREAIADKLRRENGLDYSPDEIVLSNGAKHSLFNAFMVLLDPGDEVIIQAPYWVSYPEMVKVAGGTPVIVKTDASTGFEMTPAMLEKAISPKTKVINLNNPSNPTGVVYSRDKLKAIADIAVRRNLVIVSDEIYERLTYDGHEVVSMAALGPQVRERTITVNGFSKAYAMTGWRLGYTASPKAFAKAMVELQSHSTSGPSSITQKAALAGLRGDRSFIKEMAAAFNARRTMAVERMRSIPGFDLEVVPAGAFYVFPNVSKLFGRTIGGRSVTNADELCLAVLEQARVAIVPGSSFGSPEHVRISYATSMEKLREGLDRIERLLNSVEHNVTAAV